MTTLVTHTGLLSLRSLRTLSRQPAYLMFTLVQPMVWLLLFGQLFRRIAEMPGFGGGSYLSYLTPGVVVMTAMMTAGWSGTSIVQDMERGVMDRTLTSPVRRAALVNASLVHQAIVTLVQSVIMVSVGLLAGARYDGGVRGMLVLALAAILIGVVFAAFSDAVALLVHQQEALIAVAQFLVLPLTFLSSVMIAPSLMPGWVADVARYNPVDWAAVAAREALTDAPDWGLVGGRIGLLLALAAVMAWLSARAYRVYQRSI
ncbi:ABC transporter permease [Nucisporomicrobium flavum]|jgi:ABC-2 type transport system permease protein|uniref:ABC transporter permease n=1 Tax=Nucisporomicrobium flavum TaxID=2785915 RepID=UPI0018F60FFE|nr:ABC transporter permease [Nucisporomicrobium flavum]